MQYLAYTAMVFGTTISIAAFVHDVQRLRVERELPQAAPKRLQPEIHALAAAIVALGAGYAWNWRFGVGAFVACAGAAYFIIRPLIESDRIR